MAINNDMTEETADALAMMGQPIVQFEPPGKQIVQTKTGFKTVTTQGWIKYSIALRNILSQLKGARLSVFTAICLHVNEEGEAWPSLDTLMAETGYQRAAVVEAITHLKEIGLMDVDKKKRRSSTYKPMYAAYGTSSEIKLPAVRKSNPSSSEIKPEVEPVSRTKEDSCEKPTRERTPLEIELSDIQKTFSLVSGLPEPTPNTDKEKRAAAELWYQPIRKIQRLCNGTSKQIVSEVIAYMRKQDLTIASPKSILSNVESLYAKRKTETPSPIKYI